MKPWTAHENLEKKSKEYKLKPEGRRKSRGHYQYFDFQSDPLLPGYHDTVKGEGVLGGQVLQRPANHGVASWNIYADPEHPEHDRAKIMKIEGEGWSAKVV